MRSTQGPLGRTSSDVVAVAIEKMESEHRYEPSSERLVLGGSGNSRT